MVLLKRASKSVQKSAPATKKLTMLAFYALTVAMVMDLHQYPLFATSGLSLIFFLLVGGLLWFIPVAFCSAEMATVEKWEPGGIYVWVKNTLGERWGFAAVFFQWFQITVGFIAMLYFIVGAIAAAIGIAPLSTDPVMKLVAVIILFWLITLFQLGGTKITERFGDIGSIVGIIIPTIILFSLSAFYIISGGHAQIEISPKALIPDFSKPATLVVFVAFILSYMGVEASASYASELKDPKHNYRLAMLLVVITALALNTIGGMAVALTVPTEQLSLSMGITQALSVLFTNAGIHFSYAANIVALLIAVGVTAEVSGWIVGPSRGIYMTAKQGLLPKGLAKLNRNNVPMRLILIQAGLETVWATIVTLGGGGHNMSYLIAVALTVVIYLAAYLLLFAGYFVLTFKLNNLKRSYQVWGGRPGKVITAGVGTITSLAALGISFVPPSSVQGADVIVYTTILVSGYLVALAAPFIIYAFRDKKQIGAVEPTKHIAVEDIRNLTPPCYRGVHDCYYEERDKK